MNETEPGSAYELLFDKEPWQTPVDDTEEHKRRLSMSSIKTFDAGIERATDANAK